jgi:hypothetical protein
MVNRSEKKSRRWPLLLLIIPFLVLIPPLYNSQQPELFGLPFFYWFQLFWVIVTAIITGIVYFLGA